MALLVATALTGCSGPSEDAAPPPLTVETTTVPAGRPPAPALTGTSLDGERVSLEGLRGRPVLVNVWSSW
jgi:hypothetical protein